MRYIIEYAKTVGSRNCTGGIAGKRAMLRLNRAFKFNIHATPDDPGVLHVSLPLV